MKKNASEENKKECETAPMWHFDSGAKMLTCSKVAEGGLGRGTSAAAAAERRQYFSIDRLLLLSQT